MMAEAAATEVMGVTKKEENERHTAYEENFENKG